MEQRPNPRVSRRPVVSPFRAAKDTAEVGQKRTSRVTRLTGLLGLQSDCERLHRDETSGNHR